MAGGQGTRLRPLTSDQPKPMIPIVNLPCMEHIVGLLKRHGVTDIAVTLQFLPDEIRDYFGDGSSFGCEISYLRETERLGTAGALSLFDTPPTVPLFVMNGDLLTKVNFKQMLEFHRAHRQRVSVAVRKYDVQVPFGVVELQRSAITRIVEKPEYTYFVNAGIYLLNPECLPLVPCGQFYDMPDLLSAVLGRGWNVGSFPLHEYWLDVGRLDDFEAANLAYAEIFG